MRRADYQFKLAQLELEKLQQPDNHQDIELSIAKLNLRFATAEQQILERLYQKGSVSRHDLERGKTSQKIAKLELEGKRHPERVKLVAFKIALARHALAQFEFQLAERLVKSGAVSRERHDRFLAQLKSAEANLEQRREQLGARAKAVRQ